MVQYRSVAVVGPDKTLKMTLFLYADVIINLHI